MLLQVDPPFESKIYIYIYNRNKHGFQFENTENMACTLMYG